MNTTAKAPAKGHDARWIIHAVGTALLAAVTIGAYVGIVEPAHRSRADRQRREQQAAQDTADLTAIQDGTLAMERVARTLEGRLASAVELRAIDQLNRQLAGVSELMEASRLRVQRIDPGDPAAHPRYTLVPIRVEGEGAFPDVLAFLHEMHTRLQDTEVRAFAVHAQPGAETVGFEFALAWYTMQGTSTPARTAGRAGGDESAVAEGQDSR